MSILYFDCFAGISGDMALGAFMDLGVSSEELQEVVARLGIKDLRLRGEKTSKKGITGTAARISFPADPQPHRTFQDICDLLHKSSLSDGIKAKSRQVFTLLARAESKIHGKSPNEIHFHEVGALDSLVDVVGCVAAIEIVKPAKIISSPLPFSRGQVRCAHGLLPLPAPATLEICTERSIPMTPPPLDVEGELVTPTGAALLAALADSFGSPPPLRVQRVGYGAGTKDFLFPNLLRLLLAEDETGTSPSRGEDLENILLEANIDDMSPEYYEYTFERLFEAGALDVFLTPIHMKKTRPGVKLSVLAAPSMAPTLRAVIFQETTSIGLREIRVTKRELPRTLEKVQTPWGDIAVKVSFLDGRVVNRAPEYRDCLKVAREHRVPLKQVYDIIQTLLAKEPI